MTIALVIVAIIVSFFVGCCTGLYQGGKRVGTWSVGHMKVDYDESGNPKMYCKFIRDIEVGDEYDIVKCHRKKNSSLNGRK